MLEVFESQRLGVVCIKMANMVISKEAAVMIPAALAEKYQIIPVERKDNTLILAMTDPTNFFAIDDVKMITGCEVEPVIAPEREIALAITQTYGVKELVEKAVSRIRTDDLASSSENVVSEDAPVVSIVNSLVSQAIKERASDIHLEPQEKSFRVRFRVDGILREVVSFPRHTHAAITSRVKIMSEMDIAEKRVPQDGRIKVMEGGREIDIRVSTLPTIYGEKVVMRLLDKMAGIFDVAQLGLSETNLSRYQRLYQQPYGMILVTGPTGSGKTTTLYSTLTVINAASCNIITIEDPVEYQLAGINQVQVNPKAGITFANGLRSILRQDPDIVMVGEIRDGETSDIAVRAALTGHLVLSTLHTNDAAGAITRLIDMGVAPFLVASSVLGVVAQRLVRLICPDCKQAYSPDHDSPERMYLGIGNQPITLYRGTGCPRCGHTGFYGRVAIHEIMPVTAALRELITAKASSDAIAQAAIKAGMLTMRQDGIAKALTGKTSVEEVMRVAYAG